VITEIREGASFSKALRAYERVFGRLFVALMRAAEEAGSMAQTLSYLAEAMERSERLARKIRSIIAYPIFICVFFSVVCVMMTLFVLPRFENIFSGFGAELPAITRIVFGFNKALIHNLPLIALVLTGTIVGYTFYGKTQGGRARIDHAKLRLPFVGGLISKFSMARFCRNLSMMLTGGVPISTALEISADVCANLAIRRSLLQARDEIIAGSEISTSIARQRVFPRVVVRMIKVGESSGKLPEVLEKVASVYENQMESSITLATSLLEPVIICLFGVVITCLVLAIYVPVFSVSTNVG